MMQVVKENKLKCLFFGLSLGLLAAVIAIALGGNSNAKRILVAPQAPHAGQRAYALLAGIPQDGPILGYPGAPVTLQFFGDLQCEQSRQVMLGALPSLIRRFVKTGKLQIRFRSLQTDTNMTTGRGWPEFREQQAAALAAGAQGRLWNFVNVFYQEQVLSPGGYADEAFLRGIAQQSAIDLERWEEERERPEGWVQQLEADESYAQANGMRGTPSFLFGPTDGAARPLRHFGPDEPKVFEEAIGELL